MMKRTKENESTDAGKVKRISSQELASLVVDALIRAEFVKTLDAKRAVEIAVDEIEVRKSLGDY